MQETDLLLSLRAWRPDPAEPDAVLLSALRRALQLLRGLTGLDPLPFSLEPAALELAAGYLNRRGSEGEDARTEGGLTVRWAGLAPETARLLHSFLPARAGFPDER